MYLADYHTHSRISPDAGRSMTEMAEAAIAAGLDEICFTDHMEPVEWGVTTPRESFPWEDLSAEFAAAQAAVGDRIRLRLGIELGDAPWALENTERLLSQAPPLDFVIGSVHMLSERYGGLSDVDLTLADYCVTLTLCQVEGVEAVTILVEGAVIPYGDHQLLQGSDVVLSSAEDEPVYLAADLYFLREGGGLAVESRELLVPSGSLPAEVLLQALLDGPEVEEHDLPLPEGTDLIDLWVNRDGTCYVNFSAPFLEKEPVPTSQARLLLYAIVNTLCQFSDVSAVRLLVEGESPEAYGGVPTASPLEANLDLVVP